MPINTGPESAARTMAMGMARPLSTAGPAAQTLRSRTRTDSTPSADPDSQNRRAMPVAVRLVGTYALIVTATLLVVAGLAYDLTRHQLASDLDTQLTSTVASYERATTLNKVQTSAQLMHLTRHWLHEQVVPAGGAIAFRSPEGPIMSATGSIDLSSIAGGSLLLHSLTASLTDVKAGTTSLRAMVVPLSVGGKPAGTLVVADSIADAKRGLSALLFGIGWATALGVVLATLLGFFAIRRILQPLKRVSKSAEDIEATGDLSRRVGVTGPPDEVGRLAESFDAMLTKLEGSFRSQQRFLSEASHELRTPITVARGRLELLDAPEREDVHAIVDELDRMAGMVDHLLLLARLDEGLDLAIEPVEVELVMREALLRGMADEPREATVEADPDLFVLADHERLLQVLTNLVRNAVQHAGDEARIELTARANGREAVITVHDTGRGIAPEDLPHLFERFYRAASARRQNPTGAGLGLAIVSSLVENMGGRISVISPPDQGTTFTVTLLRPKD
jgi:two-component system, OmpR family, sensor kinase